MNKKMAFTAGMFSILFASCFDKDNYRKNIVPVAFEQVQITDGFWTSWQQNNLAVTIPANLIKCEATGRIDNFAIAGKQKKGVHTGYRFNDSDVYKAIEAAAFALAVNEDSKLEHHVDSIIDLISLAQEKDGYLYTCRTIDSVNLPDNAGEKRWSYLKQSHELYCAGHMYEASVAYYKATGKQKLLDVALKNATLLCNTFGQGKVHATSGHPEIELALVKLFELTGNHDYLDLAEFFIDERGNSSHRELYIDPGYADDTYFLDHLPVVSQTEPVGHAVRANYLYAGMLDVARYKNRSDYLNALDTIWNNLVDTKLYITGGVGARHDGEAYGKAYELPNLTAYNETCAAISLMLWAERMFRAHGRSDYYDVFERTLYNGFLSGISLNGNEFCYTNPLESDGRFAFNQGEDCRAPWFACPCCPPNIARFLASLSGYIYAKDNSRLYINLFISSKTTADIQGTQVAIEQQTRYPAGENISITVNPAKKVNFNMLIRIPVWTGDRPLPGKLYTFADDNKSKIWLKVNGKAVRYAQENGYALINRTWENGDRVELHISMPVRKVIADPKVAENMNKIAVSKGPLAYCAEAVDNKGRVLNIVFPSDSKPEEITDGFPGVLPSISFDIFKMVKDENSGTMTKAAGKVRCIPYYSWANRGSGEMVTWFITDAGTID